MVLGIELIQLGVILAMVLAGGYVWALAGRGTWYAFLSKRFLFGVPWGTLVSIAGVLAFYLFAQSGLSHWNSPVTLPFRSWSYFYPEGLLAAGFAHVSPAHLVGNMIGTVVLAPIVEYAWGHYPPGRKEIDYEFPPPGDVQPEPAEMNETGRQYRHRPWVRAFVTFPGVVFLISILTSVFALGWSLGFSGTVFAFGGFAVVYFPVAAIIAMVGFTGTSILINTLLDPILRATADPGTPGPPGWWGVNVQAHMLGFLIGVLLALALLQYRDERRRPEWVFFAVLVFGLARQLYAFTTSGGEDIFLQLRGVGVIFVLGLTVLITAAVAADERSAPTPFAKSTLWPDHRLVRVLWVIAVALLGVVLWSSTVADGNLSPLAVAFAPVLLVLLVLPAFSAATGNARRQLLVVSLFIVLVVVALPSLASNLPGMSDDPVPDGETITIEDYTLTYAEDADHGRIATTSSGVIVVSESRQIWSAVVDKDELEHDGEAMVPVGGVGWREAVTATRTGWEVTGSDAAYVVDLEHDNETVRAFSSEQSEAQVQIAGQRIAVQPTESEFLLNVTSEREAVGTVPIPEENESTNVGQLDFSTEQTDETVAVFAHSNGTRVQIAEKETYE